MKLSDLKLKTGTKKLIFKDGEIVREDTQKLKGVIEFYEPNLQQLIDINEKVIDNLEIDDKDNNSLIMFKSIPFLCDIEIDVTYEEFQEMLAQPSNEFVAFMEQIGDSVDTLKQIGENATTMAETIKADKERQLEELYDQLKIVKDRAERKEILAKINQLEAVE